MLRIAVSTSAVLLLSGMASAADIPIVNPAPAPMVSPIPIAYNWSGFYIGAHGGFGWADIDGSDEDGPVIGGQIGVNWQFDGFVLGAEADAGWADLDDVDSLASARLRAGVALDRVLFYVTGGAGFEDFDEVGWVLGGGAELALTDNVSAGAEYLHYDFDDDDADVIRGRLNFKFGGLAGL
jgi:outer membrane immunogenic protein